MKLSYLSIIPVLGLLVLSTANAQLPPIPEPTNNCADNTHDYPPRYVQGYYDGYNRVPMQESEHWYLEGYVDGRLDSDAGKPNKFEDSNKQDCDTEKEFVKKGGSDPIVKDGWWYHEINTKNCISHNNKFNYDNDVDLENFCYVIIGEILAVDFDGNGKIEYGYEILNFENTNMYPYTPIGYLKTFPQICTYFDCYWWKDSKMNWEVDTGELAPIQTMLVTDYRSYEPDGVKSYKQPNSDIFRFVYGEMKINGDKAYSLKPTYIDLQ